MLHLALKSDEAIDWVSWCLQTGQLDSETGRLYLCLQSLLEIEQDEKRELKDYTNSLKLLFEEQTLKDCPDIVSGKQKFFGLHTPGLGLDGFYTNNKLLAGYRKLHRAKKQYWQ